MPILTGGIWKSTGALVYAPTLTFHNPNPPITINTPAAGAAVTSAPWHRIMTGMVAVEGAGMGGVLIE
jgi:hypothetical protein